MAGDEPYSGRPGGKKIGSGNEFRRRRGQESPVPSEQTNHHEGDKEIEERVGGRDASFDEEWKRGDLENVRGYGYGPRLAVFRLQRFEVVEE